MCSLHTQSWCVAPSWSNLSIVITLTRYPIMIYNYLNTQSSLCIHLSSSCCLMYLIFLFIQGQPHTIIYLFYSEYNSRLQDKFLLSADTLTSRQLNTIRSLVRLGSESRIRPEISAQIKHLQYLINCKNNYDYSTIIIVVSSSIRFLTGRTSILWNAIYLGFGLLLYACQPPFCNFRIIYIHF